MQVKIEQTLAVLVGLPLCSARRVADMEILHFGDRHKIVKRKGQTYEIGTHALHIQCAWRIVGSSGIIVASRDRFYPAGNISDDVFEDNNFDWDKPGANRCDERMQVFLEQHKSDALYVKGIRADLVGSLWVQLGNDYRLEVFPDDSLEEEFWRFFALDTETEHFVVTGNGIE